MEKTIGLLYDDLMDPVKLRAQLNQNDAHWMVEQLCSCYMPSVPYLHVAYVEYATPWEAIIGCARRFGLPPSAIASMISTKMRVTACGTSEA